MMEYCNGGKLGRALHNYIKKNHKPFPEEIIQHLMRQIIEAFHYIHGKKIIHRDFNLDSILLNYENEEDKENLNLMKAQVKIIGFGFASFNHQRELSDTIDWLYLGRTPTIISKILKNRGKNESDDIKSIGALCYEMLLGKPIFNEEDLEDFIEKNKKENYNIPSTFSYEIVSFLNGMLQDTPNQRLTIGELFRHYFLNNEINQFKKINLEQFSDIGSSGIINNKISKIKNITIWSIFNQKCEEFLNSILGKQLINPIDEEEEIKQDREEENVK